MECPHDPDIRYDRFGEPNPSNAPAYQERLPAYPIVVAWDDTLLLAPYETEPVGERLWPQSN